MTEKDVLEQLFEDYANGKRRKKNMECRFSMGDIVIKARPYDHQKYCRFGGEADELPIGTKGTVRDITIAPEDSYRVTVEFEGQSGGGWDMDESELEPLNRTRRKKAKKPTDKKITNPTPDDLEQARENLANALL